MFAYFLKVYCLGLVLELVKESSVSMFFFFFSVVHCNVKSLRQN